MGFELEETAYTLRFADEKYNGLVVKMREASIGDMVDMAKLDDAEVTPEALDSVFQMLAGAIIEWNLEKGGQPVGTDYDSVRRQPASFVLDIVKAWEFSVGGISAPLDDGSTSGKPPQELGLGTAA